MSTSILCYLDYGYYQEEEEEEEEDLLLFLFKQTLKLLYVDSGTIFFINMIVGGSIKSLLSRKRRKR